MRGGAGGQDCREGRHLAYHRGPETLDPGNACAAGPNGDSCVFLPRTSRSRSRGRCERSMSGDRHEFGARGVGGASPWVLRRLLQRRRVVAGAAEVPTTEFHRDSTIRKNYPPGLP